MAQEIQRKLEETEVKTKELEKMGVLVEKALRGEDGGESSKDEPELLQEWFDLMRDRTELRRYEKELLVRAQELELEDRYARLQNELRERLENSKYQFFYASSRFFAKLCFLDEPKGEKELKREEDILNEMMEIVSRRDSLVKVIEEDRLRCCHNDKTNRIYPNQSVVSNQYFISSACFLFFLFMHLMWCSSILFSS